MMVFPRTVTPTRRRHGPIYCAPSGPDPGHVVVLRPGHLQGAPADQPLHGVGDLLLVVARLEAEGVQGGGSAPGGPTQGARPGRGPAGGAAPSVTEPAPAPGGSPPPEPPGRPRSAGAHLWCRRRPGG